MAETTSAQFIAERIISLLPNLKAGTLRFFGDWFGKPNDNYHRIQSARTEGDCVIVGFDEAETLNVWDPDNITITDMTFEIASASRVLWQWYYYGRPVAPENLYFFDYIVRDGQMQVTTNVDWYKPEIHATTKAPAIRIY